MNTTSAIAVALAGLLAAPALASSLASGHSCGLYHPGSASARDRVLAEPLDPGHYRVQSHTARSAGTLYYPGPRYANPANARYGPNPDHHRHVIFTRRDHQVIAISPWCDPRGDSRIGFEDLNRALAIWLKEQGYVQGVRTHVNPNRFESADPYDHSGALPTPRATIERHIEKRERQSPVASTYLGAVSTHEIRERFAAEADGAEPIAEAND